MKGVICHHHNYFMAAGKVKVLVKNSSEGQRLEFYEKWKSIICFNNYYIVNFQSRNKSEAYLDYKASFSLYLLGLFICYIQLQYLLALLIRMFILLFNSYTLTLSLTTKFCCATCHDYKTSCFKIFKRFTRIILFSHPIAKDMKIESMNNEIFNWTLRMYFHSRSHLLSISCTKFNETATKVYSEFAFCLHF